MGQPGYSYVFSWIGIIMADESPLAPGLLRVSLLKSKHISNMANRQIEAASDAVSMAQTVWRQRIIT